MSFCKFSSEVVKSNNIEIENAFVKELLPVAPAECVKVYLYGLFLCNNPGNKDNTLESMASALNLSSEDIVSCFCYWQEVGIVTLINITPLEVVYLPIKNVKFKTRKYNKDKYKHFNTAAQEIICGRIITPTEFMEYYDLMESMHLTEGALIKIINYAVELKGNNVGYNYILTIAKNWAYEGLLTENDIENRLNEQKLLSGDIKLILKALKIKRNATVDEYQMYLNWTKELKFNTDQILTVIKTNPNISSMFSLNKLIEKCYELNLLSVTEIESYFKLETTLLETAKLVCLKLGLKYGDYTNVVETYILSWHNMGYDQETLLEIAQMCFKAGSRTLKSMNNLVASLFEKGVLNSNSLHEYLKGELKYDEKIKEVLSTLSISREVIGSDRRMYEIWTKAWNLPHEVVVYAAELSKDKLDPLVYLSKVLGNYYNNHINTLQDAKKFVLPQLNAPTKSKKMANTHDYTSQELNSVFSALKEIDL